MKYLFSICTFGAALATGGIAGFAVYSAIGREPTPVVAGTPAEIVVESPGEIIVWYYTETVANGTYTRYDEPPEGMAIVATRDGNNLAVKVDRSTTMSTGDGERRSLFSISAESPGSYNLTVSNVPEGFRLSVSVGSGILPFMFGLAAGGLSVMFLIGSVVLFALAAANVFPKKSK
jgi:hypothetical protein